MSCSEYNLRLGIMKEYEPELIATGVAKPGAYNGHPFTVEAAVAFGEWMFIMLLTWIKLKKHV